MSEVRIVSDGTPLDTFVTRLDDGKKIDRVVGASIFLDAGDVSRCSLEILAPILDVTAKVEEVTFKCPCCEQDITHECHSPKTLGGK